MKDNYLLELRSLLDGYKMEENEKNDILADYGDMYDSWIEKGYDEESTIKKLGSPRSIIRDLTEGYKRAEKPLPGSEKLIALSPFIALIAFFILGLGYDLWHPGWMVFFLIPVTAIIVEMGKTRDPHITTALSPFVAVAIFLILGFQFQLWHPGWVVFIIIPILGVWNSRNEMSLFALLVSLSPFAATITYIFLGRYGYWAEGWVVFLIIPMLGMLSNKNKLEVFIWEVLCIGGIIGYLYILMGDTGYETYAWLTFIPVILYSPIAGNWKIFGGNTPLRYKVVSVVAAALFLGFGLLGYWEVSWIAWLIIPVYAIITESKGKEKLVALSPFIALVIFFFVGYVFDAWSISWMAFLLIPIIAIIKNA